MLSLQVRSDLLVQAAELVRQARFSEIVEILSPLTEEELFEEPGLAHLLSGALFQSERLAEARRLNSLLAEPCRRRGRDRLYRQRLNLEGVLCVAAGEFEEAEEVLSEAFSAANQAGDNWTLADATMNLGMLAWVRCQWDQALVELQRAMTAYTLLGLPYRMAGCHQNLALTYRELGNSRAADAHFENALSHYMRTGGDREIELAAVEAERALLILRLGDFERAEVMARRALSRVSNRGLARREGEALRVLGMVLMARGRGGEGTMCLELALDHARDVRDRLLEAEVLEELSESTEGHYSVTSKREAAEIYRSLGIQTRAVRALNRRQHNTPERDVQQ